MKSANSISSKKKYYTLYLNNNFYYFDCKNHNNLFKVIDNGKREDRFFYKKGLFGTKKFIKSVPVYDDFMVMAEFVNGKMVDLITGNVITYYPNKYDECEFINGLSYNYSSELSSDVVLSELQKLDDDAIKRYKAQLTLVENDSISKYNEAVAGWDDTSKVRSLMN